MNNCYSSLGSINGNPKKQNCGDGRCDPPDRGIDPNPKYRDLFLQIYRPEPSNGAGFGEVARLTYNSNAYLIGRPPEAPFPPSSISLSEQTNLINTFGFKPPGSFLTYGGEYSGGVTLDEVKYYISTIGSEMPLFIITGKESITIGGLLAAHRNMSITDLLKLPRVDILGMSFASQYNNEGGLRSLVDLKLARVKTSVATLSAYQNIDITNYETEGLWAIESTFGDVTTSYTNETKTKITIIPKLLLEYTLQLNCKNDLVFTAGFEVYSPGKGFLSTETSASIQWLIRNPGGDPYFGLEVYARKNNQIYAYQGAIGQGTQSFSQSSYVLGLEFFYTFGGPRR